MNSEDKEILELLKRNQTVKAPEDFTFKVMKSVMEVESSKNSSFQFSNLILSLLIFSSMIASIFVFYYFDNTFFDGLISTLSMVNGIFSNQFTWIDSQTISFLSLAKENSFVIGIVLSILVLLSFDRLFLSRKLNVNVLSIV